MASVDGASASSEETAHKNPIAELKNGKVVFKQRPKSLEKASETMQEIVKFREMLDSRVRNQDQPLVSIPNEYGPLIVKLAQESDKGVVPLARQIRSILLPAPEETDDVHRLSLESNLPLPVVENAIKMLMTRVNYGIDVPLGQKLPATVCVWRWEVQDAYRDWLPRSARENADARLAERIQAGANLRAAFESLSQAEQDAILDPKRVLKLPARDANNSEMSTLPTGIDGNISGPYLPEDAPIDGTHSQVLPENLVPKRRKKPFDPEKAAKIKDKEEKRAAKVEKEKKQKEAQDRSRSIMTSFFEKAKPSARDFPINDSNVSTDSLVENEFQRTFKPFALKKGAELAPHNWFSASNKRVRNWMSGVTHEEPIVIDDDIPAQGSSHPTMSSDAMTMATTSDSSGSLQELIARLHQCNQSFCVRARKALTLKVYNPRTVRDTISQLNDAEVAGDPTQVRHLLSTLENRRIFPVKVLIFHEDSRPGYYGTWTRSSRTVGPRTPFERDILARDYGYDSGEDWEDEAPGDADDVVEDADDDELDVEDVDSDLDSWLVDDDDEVRSPLDLDDSIPPLLELSMPPPKRKAENTGRQPDKKRKVVVPLVPYARGPFWESQIGHCEYDPFNVYRIQFLNDVPHPVDPFTFISAMCEEGQKLQVDPSLLGALQTLAGPAASSTSKRTLSAVPKTVFPEAHLSTLLAKITQLATPSLTFLVESIYQDLRVHKIKKNAIEAKVRELSEKSKERKVWVIKQAVQALHQIS